MQTASSVNPSHILSGSGRCMSWIMTCYILLLCYWKTSMYHQPSFQVGEGGALKTKSNYIQSFAQGISRVQYGLMFFSVLCFGSVLKMLSGLPPVELRHLQTSLTEKLSVSGERSALYEQLSGCETLAFRYRHSNAKHAMHAENKTYTHATYQNAKVWVSFFKVET